MTVEQALAKSEHYIYQDSAVVKTLAAEVIRLREEVKQYLTYNYGKEDCTGCAEWQERAEDAEESSRVNYAAFSDQLCRHKDTLRRAEAAEAEVARMVRHNNQLCKLLSAIADYYVPTNHPDWELCRESIKDWKNDRDELVAQLQNMPPGKIELAGTGLEQLGKNSESKRSWLVWTMVQKDICPDCGSELDTGYECNGCDKDWIDVATSPEPERLPTHES